MPVKRIDNYNDYLRSKGVRFLTGEACALGLRKLYDVDEDAVFDVENYFGMTMRSEGRSGGAASFLMSDDARMGLCIYFLFLDGADEVYLFNIDGSTHIRAHINLDETEREREKRMLSLFDWVRRWYAVPGQQHRNFASVHAIGGFNN